MPATTPHVDQTTADQLKSVIERIESVHEEKKQLESDIADIYAEARGNGFEVKAIKAIIAERRKNPAELQELEAIIDTYKAALATPEPATGHLAAA